jgi:hypothetical protein
MTSQTTASSTPTSSTSTSSTSTSHDLLRPSIFARALLAAAAAAIVNLVIWLIATAGGASMSLHLPPMTFPLALAVVSSPGPIILVGFLAWVLAKKWPRSRILLAWLGLIIVILPSPAALIAAADVPTAVALMCMHVAAGVLWFVAMMIRTRSRS